MEMSKMNEWTEMLGLNECAFILKDLKEKYPSGEITLNDFFNEIEDKDIPVFVNHYWVKHNEIVAEKVSYHRGLNGKTFFEMKVFMPIDDVIPEILDGDFYPGVMLVKNGIKSYRVRIFNSHVVVSIYTRYFE